MAYCTVSARMDTEVKAEFFQVCEELGLSPSTAINIFAKAMIRKNGFPFVLQIENHESYRGSDRRERSCRTFLHCR